LVLFNNPEALSYPHYDDLKMRVIFPDPQAKKWCYLRERISIYEAFKASPLGAAKIPKM